MKYNKSKEQVTIQKTIRMPEDLIKKIEELSIENDRDFSKQTNYMLKKFLEIKEI